MPIYCPNPVFDGLVFMYDAANPRNNAGGTATTCLIQSNNTIAWNTAPVANTASLNFVTVNSQSWASTNKSVLPANGYSAFTMEVWVYPTNTVLVNQTFLGTTNTATQIGMSGSSIVFGRNAGAGGILVSSLGTVTANTWYQVAMVYDGNLANTFAVFRNGNCTSVTNNMGSKGNAVLNGPHFIGTYNSGGEYYDGGLAIARVYNRALSNTEVRQNFDAYRSRYGI